jgi:RNA polymerase sigma factor (sigma-70 family)
MSCEPSTARPLPCYITIQGADYLWTQEDGLDPEAILTLQRFIWKEARRYQSIGIKAGLSVDDLVQEGQHGALLAARRFDPDKGFQFLTYAVWWIRNRILEVLRGHQVYIPKEVSRALRRVDGLPPVCSLDFPLFADGATIADTIPGDQGQAVTEAQMEAQDVRRLVRLLTPKEQQILIRHYGLHGRPDETLEAIGNTYGVSRERIRQIESQALARLRKHIAYKG